MAANYPNSVKTFVNKVDNTDAVIASDVNLLYAEVSAIESVVGVTPASTTGWSGTFDQTSTDFTTVTSRIQNIEYGLNIAYNQRVNTLGGSTIGSSGTTIGLTIQTTGTGNLLNFKNTSGTIVTSVTKDGWINVIDGGDAS
jgi:hypothetical protein